jgi:hypothetical protein
MKTLPPGLQAHLGRGTTTLAWCWRIARRDGAVLGFTDHDRSLTFGGTEFEPESGFAASELRSGSDLAVDAQDAEGVLSSDRITETDILDGRWDDAEVKVWRVNWHDVSQRVLMRRGAIGQIRRGRLAFAAEVRSLTCLARPWGGRSRQPATQRSATPAAASTWTLPPSAARDWSPRSLAIAASPPRASVVSRAAGSRSARSTGRAGPTPVGPPRSPGTAATVARSRSCCSRRRCGESRPETASRSALAATSA